MSKWSHDWLNRVILWVLVLFTVSPAVRADNFTWTLRTTPVGAIWQAIAASSDCQKIAIGGENTYIYTSTNGGISWTQRAGSGSRNWYSLASSVDGTVLAAGAYNGYIYTSTDGGGTWTERTGAGSGYWNGMASSSDGALLVAAEGNTYIYTSTDSGATWTARTSAGSRSWHQIACSPDGTKIAAVAAGSYVYTSSDGGATWITRSGVGSQSWIPLDASSDIKTIIVGAWNGYVKSTSDSGNTWTQHTSVGSAFWWGAACSADGNVMGMAQNYPNGYVWTTTNGGSTWAAETSAGSRTWWDVVSSSDGTRLVASYSGYVYVGTTNPSAPTVTTTSISSITSTTASSGGDVTLDGWVTVTARGVCWSTSANPTISGSYTTDGSGTGAFTSSLSSLTPGTLYHVRAYATNSVGTSYGGDSTFTTLTTPTVTTTTITAITSTTASGGGAIPDSGGATITAKGVCWNTSTLPTTANSKTTDSTGATSFTSSLTSLTPGALYHVRAYATNSVGTSYGSESDFTTLITPTVTTSAITSITSTTASSGGNVTSDGGATVTARGVCWSTSTNPTVANSHITNGTGTGAFTSSITGLDPDSTYYVRAYATNSVGTAYGNQFSFITLKAYTISGYVRSGGEGVEGVVLNGLPGDPLTDTTGYFSAIVDSGSHWTVIPTANGCTFQPDNRIYVAVSFDYADQDYTETCFSEGIDEDKDNLVPKEYQLSQNHPNPFNPTTEIKFGLPQNSHVTLKIYNVVGQEVITLLDRNLSAGIYQIRWNGVDNSGRTVSSGVYFFRMQAGDYVQTKQMLLLK